MRGFKGFSRTTRRGTAAPGSTLGICLAPQLLLAVRAAARVLVAV